MNTRAKLIFAILGLGLILPGRYLLAQSTPQSNTSQSTNTTLLRPAKLPPPTLNKPVYRLKDNSILPLEQLISRSQAIGTIPKKAKLKSAKLLNLSEHYKQREQITNGILLESAEIHPKRLVWEVTLDYPEGFDARPGHYDQATVTKVVDAETGKILSVDVDAPAKAFHSRRPPEPFSDFNR